MAVGALATKDKKVRRRADEENVRNVVVSPSSDFYSPGESTMSCLLQLSAWVF